MHMSMRAATKEQQCLNAKRAPTFKVRRILLSFFIREKPKGAAAVTFFIDQSFFGSGGTSAYFAHQWLRSRPELSEVDWPLKIKYLPINQHDYFDSH